MSWTGGGTIRKPTFDCSFSSKYESGEQSFMEVPLSMMTDSGTIFTPSIKWNENMKHDRKSNMPIELNRHHSSNNFMCGCCFKLAGEMTAGILSVIAAFLLAAPDPPPLGRRGAMEATWHGTGSAIAGGGGPNGRELNPEKIVQNYLSTTNEFLGQKHLRFTMDFTPNSTGNLCGYTIDEICSKNNRYQQWITDGFCAENHLYRWILCREPTITD